MKYRLFGGSSGPSTGDSNRARYDTDRIVAAFAARQRNAVDLDSVRDDLASAVQMALEPAHVSVWIAPEVLWGLSGRPDLVALIEHISQLASTSLKYSALSLL